MSRAPVVVGAAGGSLGGYVLRLLLESALQSSPPIAAPIEPLDYGQLEVCPAENFLVAFLRRLQPWDYVVVFVAGACAGPLLDLWYIARRALRVYLASWHRSPGYTRIA